VDYKRPLIARNVKKRHLNRKIADLFDRVNLWDSAAILNVSTITEAARHPAVPRTCVPDHGRESHSGSPQIMLEDVFGIIEFSSPGVVYR